MARTVMGSGKSGSCLTRHHEGDGGPLECDYPPCTCNCHPRNEGRGEPIAMSDKPDTEED